MRVYFATWMDNTFGEILTNKNAKNRLISFFFLKEQKATEHQITTYVSNGKLNSNKK